MKAPSANNTKDGLIAILKDKSDLTILQQQGWYRIPVASAPKRWPPRWLAFYQPKNFGEDAYRIRFFGQVKDIHSARRHEIFPNEIASAKSDREYYILKLARLEEREVPIPSYRPRRLVFIPTTWGKFEEAEQINDLFDDSPLEDQLWVELKRLAIEAERQWAVGLSQSVYHLDFALFCKTGPSMSRRMGIPGIWDASVLRWTMRVTTHCKLPAGLYCAITLARSGRISRRNACGGLKPVSITWVDYHRMGSFHVFSIPKVAAPFSSSICLTGATRIIMWNHFQNPVRTTDGLQTGSIKISRFERVQ